MKQTSQPARKTAYRVLSLTVLIIAWVASTATSEIPTEGYVIDIVENNHEDTFFLEDTGYCLPVIRLGQTANSLTIYFGDEPVAWATCEDGKYDLTAFYYNGSGECAAGQKFDSLVDSGTVLPDGGSEKVDGGIVKPMETDASANPDAGIPSFPYTCTCYVLDDYKAGFNQADACQGTFRVDATFSNGETKSFTYEQQWEEPQQASCGK